MTEQQFIDDVILPEAKLQGMEIEARLHERHADGDCCFAILFENNGARGASPIVVPMGDVQRAQKHVRSCLSNIKKFIATGIVPDGCYAYGKGGKLATREI
jgi:hypothetical protein